MSHFRKLKIKQADKFLDYEYHIGEENIFIRCKETKYKKSEKKENVGLKTGYKKQNKKGDWITKTIISPKMIAHYILFGQIKSPENYIDSCSCEDCKSGKNEKEVRCDPFDVEILEKINYWYSCKPCYDRRAEDI